MTAFYHEEEIVQQLLTTNEVFSDKDRADLKKITEDDDMEKFHEKFGKQIRNFYNFWNVQNTLCFEYKTEKMIKQPSELSFDIIVSVWEKLNENNGK